MIKINLLKRKSSQRSAVAGGQSLSADVISGQLKDSFARMSNETKSVIITLIFYAVIGYVGNYLLEDRKQKDLVNADSEVQKLQNEITLLDSEIAKTKGYEKIKKELEEDERAIKTKIETIQKLVDERATPPKMLMTLSQATPPDVWIEDFSIRDNDIRIKGSALGLTIVSDFMKALEETVYFKDVALKNGRQQRERGVEVANFDLELKKR